MSCSGTAAPIVARSRVPHPIAWVPPMVDFQSPLELPKNLKHGTDVI